MRKLIVLLTLALVAGSGYAATVDWIGGTGDWSAAANWSTGTVPGGNTEDAYVASGTVAITADPGLVNQLRLIGTSSTPVVNIGSNVDFNKLFVSWDPGQSGIINQTAGNVDIDGANGEMIIARYGAGTYNLSGGTMTHSFSSRDTFFGLGGTGGAATGTFTLSGSATFEKTSSAREVYVGFNAGSTGVIDLSGSSSFTQNSGNDGDVVLGRSAATSTQNAANGTVNISDTATFVAKSHVRVGDAGSGTIDMDGGTFTHNTYGNVWIGDDADSVGVVNVAGTAQFTTTKTFLVGNNGHGEINQSGGTLTSSGNMYVGNKNGATGEYNLSSGTLNGGTIYLGQEVGAKGTMNVSGGAANVGIVYVGRHGEGALIHTDGDIDASHFIMGGGDGRGDYTISGGSLDLTSYLRLWSGDDSSTFTVSGSAADHIEINKLLLGNEIMTVELDSTILGSTLITADDTGAASELNGTFVLDTLVDFSSVANGTVYDIMWAAAGFGNIESLTFSDLSSSAEFTWGILDNVGVNGLAGTGQMLQVTVVPEPATISLLTLGSYFLLRRKKHKNIR